MNNPAYTVGYNWGHECYGTIDRGGPQKPPGGKYQEPTGTGAKSLDCIIAEALPKGGAGFRLSLNFQNGLSIGSRALAPPARSAASGGVRASPSTRS